MPHAIWSGSLSFGLVNIPVNMYSATSPKGLNFNLLRKEDLSPINYVRVARADGKEVPFEDIVKGYEYRKGDYVVLCDEDFRKADIKKTGSIEIIDFVDGGEIDSIYFEKPYFLEPVKGAAKPYALLAESLTRSGKVGVAKFVMRTREHLGVIRPRDGMIVLEQLRYDAEIRPPSEFETPKATGDEKQIDMALKLIEEMTEHFNPKEFHDTYKEELLAVIDEKAKKGTVKPRGEVPKATEFANIMEELKKSLKEAQTAKK